MSKDVLQLAATLEKLQTEWWDLALDEDYPGALGPPATANQIAALSSKVGHPLPPSYRVFLGAHNGWSQFSGEASILSTGDYHEAWYDDARQLFGECLIPDANPFDLYIPIVAGPDTRLAVFLDPGKTDPEGEAEVVELHDGEEMFRHADFGSFLEARVVIYESLIQTERNGSEAP
ncbi:MAG: SMI1/KNR4 family protein [Myxococcota bacterium]